MADTEKMEWETLGSPGGLLELWHSHRLPVVVATILFSIAWAFFTRRPSKELLVTETSPPAAASAKLTPAEPTISVGENEIVGAPVGAPVKSPLESAVRAPRRIKGELRKTEIAGKESGTDNGRCTQVLVFFSSLTTTTAKTAKDFTQSLKSALGDDAKSRFLDPTVLDLAEIDYDEYFISPPKPSDPAAPVDFFYLFLIPSYNIDTINDNVLEHLQETHHDFRIDTAPLSGLLGYSVFGFGDREGWPTEEEGFCFQAKEVDRWMAKLTGRKRAFPLGMADKKVDLVERLQEWTEGVADALKLVSTTGSLGEGVPGSGDADESDVESGSGDEYEEDTIEDSVPLKKVNKKNTANIDDLEDLGRIMKLSQGDSDGSKAAAPIAVDFTTYGKTTTKRPAQTIKEMVPKGSPTYTSLTKQGYSIVGSHSGVKICRWTKSALRGRGSCYKYSFYGIASHQCMETTPSLSCSNKCVFCWRHGTNPVGTSWRWVVDPPELIFEGVKAGHYQKIKMMRGVPGVRAERFAEAMRIRHCALSLVGEPIFYPHINEFLAMLHAERISSFLVCNAQHPDQLAALKAVTQLYVSIDASNRESLRKIDRPLHRDFWERFQRCLDILREKRFKHRTVFRLTLVKGFNVEDEVDGYADLVERGLPCFVEVKGVTYCGTSTSAGAGLSMANVPFYAEVADFVTALDRKLKERGLDYGIAAEHAHSCCVLLASGRFRTPDGKWHTRIDYDRFFELLEERGPDGDWLPEDYMGPETPEWATWGNGGFDPRDERVDRKGRKIET
ncbi:radical SAM superfamily-domain-containing protein [Xylariaceae sp. FL0594]|nr:radical SAM superfamily-domain-containing protein [Xylariaceae sp. FL0594]